MSSELFNQITLTNDFSGKKHLTGLPGLSLALNLAALIQNIERPLLIITPDQSTSERLKSELLFFLAAHLHQQVFSFPDRETLPYDIFSPHQDLISERLLTLYKIPALKKGIIF